MAGETWRERLASGRVFDNAGVPVTLDTPYNPGTRLFYYREVPYELPIPFEAVILHQDEHILVADKPHFLPVVPSGKFVNECLVYRLKKQSGNEFLSPIHRIDKDTAGIVLFSCAKETRGAYQRLFSEGKVKKLYEAVTEVVTPVSWREKCIETRIVHGTPWMLMKNSEGTANARTVARFIRQSGTRALFEFEPLTGKKHQIRLHASFIGCPILNDRLYPVLKPEREPDYSEPLQLLAKNISFIDPVSGTEKNYISRRGLEFSF
jgi:tRNA pseudouridine32 synthase/23S rRNA pseudouridine746 synthase